jgi:hypothetical protein
VLEIHLPCISKNSKSAGIRGKGERERRVDQESK